MKYQRYSAYKDSGVEWLGEVPEHWESRRLRYCCQVRNEKVSALDINLPYLGLENIESRTGKSLTAVASIDPEGIANRYLPGDVLFGKLRPYLAKVYASKEQGICTTELLVLKPTATTSPFLMYQLLTDEFIRIVDSSTYGTKMPRANWDFIGNIPLTVPPLDEQGKIAAFLDRETAQIDALIARQERLIAVLQEKRQALISHAVTKGLNPAAPMKDSGVEWLGDIPAAWTMTKIRHLAKSGNKTFVDGDWIELPYITSEGVRLIQTGNIGVGQYKEQGFRFISEDSFVELACTEVLAKDVLICRLADPVGRACLAPEAPYKQIASVDVCILKTREDVDERFVVYFLSSIVYLSFIASVSRGGTRERISRSFLGRVDIPLPSSQEQRAIADFLDSELTKIDVLIGRVSDTISLLLERRTALISAAVTGKIDVRNQMN